MTLFTKFAKNYFLFFFILSALQTISLDLRLIPVIKIALLIYCLLFFEKYYRMFEKSNTSFYVGASLLNLSILYIIFTFLFYNFNNKPLLYFFDGVIKYIVPMCAFFWTVSIRTYTEKELYKNISAVLFLTALVGLILYFVAPSWYVNWRLSHLASWVGELNASNVFDNYKNLSSVYSHPYQIAYTSIFLLSYVLYDIYKRGLKRVNVLALIVTLPALILAQQRIATFFAVFLLISYTIIGLKKGKESFSFIAIFLGIAIIFLFIYYYNSINFLISRYQTMLSFDIFNDGRYNIPLRMLSRSTSLFWGMGFNCTGHIAFQYNDICIADAEFLKLFYEIGLFGTSLFLSFLFLTIIYAYKYKCWVELPVVLFFLFAMIGANPFEKDNVILIYWICAGRVWYYVRLHGRISKNCIRYFTL